MRKKLLQTDSSLSHSRCIDRGKLDELPFQVVLQPPYLPDIDFSDFSIILKTQTICAQADEEVIGQVDQYFNDPNPDDYKSDKTAKIERESLP